MGWEVGYSNPLFPSLPFSYAVSLVLRLLGGEPLIHLPPTIKYPYYDEHHYVGDSKEIDHEGKGQLFPFRTFSMMMGLMANLLVCYITHKYVHDVGPQGWFCFRIPSVIFIPKMWFVFLLNFAPLWSASVKTWRLVKSRNVADSRRPPCTCHRLSD